MDWKKYPNFSKSEFDCKHSGENRMRAEFMDVLQQIRTTYDKPMIVTSGYRAPSHPVERDKSMPGEHTYGCAVDIAVGGGDVLELIVICHGYGIRRLGVQQKGGGRFLHIGMGDILNLNFPPVIWTY